MISVGQLVTDAVFNAEHAGPGVPAHHRSSDELRTLHLAKNTAAKPSAGERR